MPEKGFLDYYISETDKKFEAVHTRFDRMDEKLDILVRFRWMLIGAGIGTSMLVSVLWEAVKAMAGGR